MNLKEKIKKEKSGINKNPTIILVDNKNNENSEIFKITLIDSEEKSKIFNFYDNSESVISHKEDSDKKDLFKNYSELIKKIKESSDIKHEISQENKLNKIKFTERIEKDLEFNSTQCHEFKDFYSILEQIDKKN